MDESLETKQDFPIYVRPNNEELWKIWRNEPVYVYTHHDPGAHEVMVIGIVQGIVVYRESIQGEEVFSSARKGVLGQHGRWVHAHPTDQQEKESIERATHAVIEMLQIVQIEYPNRVTAGFLRDEAKEKGYIS